MKTNPAGIALIKKFEGFSPSSYLCPAGVWTIGYGTTRYHDGTPVRQGQRVSLEQAEKLLQDDLRKFELGVKALVKVSLRENQFAALVSFAYNVGLAALERSTLLKLLNSSAEDEEVAFQFLRWNKAGNTVLPGLTRRREAESSLFLS